ncbi:MAG: hypothetical protein GY838_12280 [bacterium]|nr:hypothetical protein [bacterium]
MKRICPTLIALGAVILLAGTLPVASSADETGTGRAAWLLQRGAGVGGGLADTRHFQTEIGGGDAIAEDEGLKSPDSPRGSVGLKMLASAVLPGSGEVLLGHKHGFAIMAADILAWTQVSKHHGDGGDMRDQYYAFADEHYSDAMLMQGYFSGSTDIERSGEGALYFPDFPTMSELSIEALERTLPLYVTKEEDRREYYENLGKWDQFVFGWDDYLRASVSRAEYNYEPTMRKSDLTQPWVSKNRELYRDMREQSNDSFKKRDRWLYVNIGLRVFSVLETAWLGGLLGGGDDSIAVAGHRVQLVTAPEGPYRGRVGAKVWF